MRWVADLGGSHGRFARLESDGRPGERVEVSSRQVADLATAIEIVGRRLGTAREVAFAVAGPVAGPSITLTNASWRFSIADLRHRFGWTRMVVLNDFEALARGIAAARVVEVETIRPGPFEPSLVRAVLGPGTGLGMAALLPDAGGAHALASEGGHRDLAAATEREWRVVRALLERHGDAAAERVLSGPGLVELHDMLQDPVTRSPRQEDGGAVAALARQGDACALEAVELFASLLGAFAGDLILTLGARGGLYLAGGVLAGLGDLFRRDAFEARLLAKGRLRGYLESVPVARLRDPVSLALEGAALALTGANA